MPVKIAVNGTLMRGLELNENLVKLGGIFLYEAETSPQYRLWSINDVHPAMQKVYSNGNSIQLEIWELPEIGLATLLLEEPPGLSLGKIILKSNQQILGILGENHLCLGQKEITQFGGWRNYIKEKEKKEKEQEKQNTNKGFPSLRNSLPYKWPFNNDFRKENTVLIIIDMQNDFVSKGGYIDLMGYDVTNLRKVISPLQKLLNKMREKRIFDFTYS